MQKISGLEKWNLSEVPHAQQKACVLVFVPYPEITADLLELTPKGRQARITQQMQHDLDAVLASHLLVDWKLLASSGPHKRHYAVQGNVCIADLPALAEMASVASIQVESTNGRLIKAAKPRQRKSFYCIKMTVAIQIEGRERGMQDYEERYVLFKAYTEDEARRKAEQAATEYGKPYLGGNDLLVRWQVESIDDVYEVTPAYNASGRRSWDGAEVFSVLKGRRITKERVWHHAGQ